MKLRFKNIGILLTTLGITTSGIVLTTTACSNQTETQIILDIYDDKCDQRSKIIKDENEYLQLWSNIINDSTTINGVKQSSWCLEYSIYLPFLFTSGLTVINDNKDDTHSIALPTNQTLWSWSKDGSIDAEFLTGNSNLTLIDQEPRASYLGYLHLTFNKPLELLYSGESKTYEKGTIIEFMLSFSDLALNILPPDSNNNWWSQTVKLVVGDTIGMATIYDSHHNNLGSSHIDKIDQIDTAANYFGAYKGE